MFYPSWPRVDLSIMRHQRLGWIFFFCRVAVWVERRFLFDVTAGDAGQKHTGCIVWPLRERFHVRIWKTNTHSGTALAYYDEVHRVWKIVIKINGLNWCGEKFSRAKYNTKKGNGTGRGTIRIGAMGQSTIRISAIGQCTGRSSKWDKVQWD